MHISSRSRWAAIALCGLLAACSGDDIDQMFGRNDDDNGDNRSTATAAVNACVEEADDQGWAVLDTDDVRESGQNDIEVSMRVRQGDGDVRDVDCIYDTGDEEARLES